VNADDISIVLRQAGINPGDTLMIHGDSIVAAQLRYKNGVNAQMNELFTRIVEYLGNEGTLIVPTFTYSFANNEDFDVDNSQSRVGFFSEYFRKMDGVVRSLDPMFSVAALGKNKNDMKDLSVVNSFGKGSIFEYLHNKNAKIMNLGCDFLITFTHYVEQDYGVSYRSFKKFSGNIISQGEGVAVETLFYLRDLTRKSEMNLSSLRGYLNEHKKISIVPFGRFATYTVSSRDFYDSAKFLLSKNESSLIEEGVYD